jgi:hypothetical protein
MEGQTCLLSGGAPDSPVHHQTVTVAVRCAISFLFWRIQPLHLWGSWRTVHCSVHTGHSGAPLPTVGAGYASFADCAADRWLTGQFDVPPDSSVNYSRTPPNFSRERPFHRRPAWCTEHCPVHHQTVRCARLS